MPHPRLALVECDPAALAARLTDLRERREIAHRDLVRAQKQERRLTRLLDGASERGLDAAYARAWEVRSRVWLRIDAAAGACDDLSDLICEIEREIEDLDRPEQEAEERHQRQLRSDYYAGLGVLR